MPPLDAKPAPTNPASTPLRVLVVTNLWPTETDPSFGSFVKAQMESLRPLGIEYDVCFFNGRESKWNYFRGIASMRRMLSAKKYDLVHAHFGLSGWVARMQWKAPLVVSFMGDDVLGRPRRDGSITPFGRFLQVSGYVLARLVPGVIVKSEEMKRRLRMPRARVIPNGVDLELFRPQNMLRAREELGLDPARKYVLFPYNPAEQRKRFDLIETAVNLVRAEIPEIEILHVRGKPREQIPTYMNAADVFILASVFEGSPNALKEAMAINLPVITVKAGDSAELIGNTEGCYLVDREPREIATRLVQVLRTGKRTRGREWIAHLSMPTVAARIVQYYREIL